MEAEDDVGDEEEEGRKGRGVKEGMSMVVKKEC